MYKGVSILGLGDYCSVFSATQQFGDGFSRGIQHLFYEDYTKDLLRMAVTLNKFKEGYVEYADIHYDGVRAPDFLPIIDEGTDNLYDVFTSYRSENSISRKTKAYALKEALVLEEEVENTGLKSLEFIQYAYMFFNFDERGIVKYDEGSQSILWQNSFSSKNLVIGLHEETERVYISKEPKATALVTLHKVLKDLGNEKAQIHGKDGISAALGKNTILKPGNRKIFKWYIIPCSTLEKGIFELEAIRKKNSRAQAQLQNDEFFKLSNVNVFEDKEIETAYYRNLLTIKALNLKGVIPADLIGYYYSGQGTPTVYVRDSLMVARAFLYCGHLSETKQILVYIGNLPLKVAGEFYQRYDAYGTPSEGQNNDIKHQFDSNGYFLSLICQYFNKTGELLLSFEKIRDFISCIKENQSYKGLVGPEGGVNEGVYGGSYITSTNMFIAGGLYQTKELLSKGLSLKLFKTPSEVDLLIAEIIMILDKLEIGIEAMWDGEKGYYKYGYSKTCEHVVERYDVPQYFSVLYGYPNTERLKENNLHLLKYASFYKEGIGYSQQAYHHGVWIFNTAACAQYNYINGDISQYNKKLKWILKHLNGYFLAPEAVSAEKESICFNNPLNWACAEVVATIAIPWHLIN